MNEDLWDKVKDTLEKGLQKATETTVKAIEVAKEQAEVARLKLHISGLKSKISKEFAELGGVVYELAVKEEKDDIVSDERVQKIFERIRALELELVETQKNLEEISRKEQP